MKSKVERILIINLAFIGDVILSTPVARALRAKYPNSRIDMLVVPVAAEVAVMNPYVDCVIEYDKKGRHRSWGALRQLVRQLRAERYDLAVATNFALRGALIARASGAPCRLGYAAQHGEWFLTHASKPVRSAKRHEAENYLDVLKPLAISAHDVSLTLQPPPEAYQELQSRFVKRSGEKWLVICPVGSYERKSWSKEGYAALIKALAGRARIFLIGGQREKAALDQIREMAEGQGEVLAGELTLPQVAALLQQSDLLVSVDTGPLHIGQGVGIPTLALYGPTDPAIWGPRGVRDRVIYHPDCEPCWGKGDCLEKKCMANISQAEVIKNAMEMLGL
ncbi:glycosyltransferase family 9 protein [Azotosporobacter soli]|uniref:glycosyltransferase family 9 protein n=1 Tax=Azotosporobacter soli TaxID=3055040 RepID=UPI0031FEC564